jgi:hypothetical protein
MATDGLCMRPESIQYWSRISSTHQLFIVERWGNPIFFVQDPETRKWGALGISINLRHTPSEEKTYNVKEIMPMIADDIYEDEMMDGCGTFYLFSAVSDQIEAGFWGGM